MARMKNPKKKKNHSLEPLRREVKNLFARANKLVSYIMNSGRSTVGFEEAKASLLPKDREAVENGRELFTTEDKKDFWHLRREINRVANFLNSDSGTQRSAEYAQEQLEANERYYHAFKESNFHEGGHIDERLDRDVAEVAFEIYRRIEENGADVLYGKGGYGSENLINLIYNSLVESGDYSSDWAIGEAIKKGRKVLQQKRREINFNGTSAYATGHYDDGILKKVKEAHKFEDIDW